MSSFFHNLGRWAGPTLRKGQWWWASLTGSSTESLAAEEQVGRDLIEALRGRLVLDAYVPYQEFVEEIGERLIASLRGTPAEARRFRFQLVIDETPNALAMPGGFVFMTRSLLELCGRDPHATAFVLAHEMGHVVKEHPMQRALNDTAISALLRAVPAGRVAGPLVKQAGHRLLQSAYSREQEFEADRYGVHRAAAAGFEPRAAFSVFEKLVDRTVRSDGTRSRVLLEYFASHPPLEERIAAIDRELRRSQP